MPDVKACERARLSRDVRFDGLFYTAVTSTGIYCRPVCPAPPPLARHVRYYANAAAAEAAGFRPCLRCRPELAPGHAAWRRGDDVVARSLALIDEGLLAEAPLATLAARVEVSERQLRRLFVERLGAAPVGVHGTRRLLLAKQLLADTSLPVTDVAMAAGFNSLRRFNAVFREAYRMAPRDVRRQWPPEGQDDRAPEALVLRLGFRPPYDFDALLAFFRYSALPGLEVVTADSYARVYREDGAFGWLRVSRWPSRRGDATHALRLEVHGARPAVLLSLVSRVRRMFDLDSSPGDIATVLRRDARLKPLVTRMPGLRLPGAWDRFEQAVRTVVGQQVSVAAARTFAGRLAAQFGVPVPDALQAVGFTRLFPEPQALADAPIESVGLTRDRARTIRGVARAVLDGRVDLSAASPLDTFIARWTALPGIGPWTAQSVAMLALSHPDACPVEDLVLRRAYAGAGEVVSAATLRQQAELWRPWRAYAAMHLWHDATGGFRGRPPQVTTPAPARAGAPKHKRRPGGQAPVPGRTR